MGLRRGSGIEIKTTSQLEAMRAAGLVVAHVLDAISQQAAPGVSTAELDATARDILADHGATSPFLGYKAHGTIPFPAVICASVNAEVVHGIPGSRRLRDGDLLSVDFGATLDGWVGDAAVTLAIGRVSEAAAALSDSTRTALWAGLDAARPGGRLTDISHAVETALDPALGIVEEYGGHGIGSRMHMEPFILNYGSPGRGPVLKPGMTLAIEPMATIGSPAVQVHDDGWTISTVAGGMAAHWEHTVAVTDAGPWVLTALEDVRL
jgi:methionyl aminopeptidase